MKATKLTSKLKIPSSSITLPFGILNPFIISHNIIDVGGIVFLSFNIVL
jgi:hypothetical protein